MSFARLRRVAVVLLLPLMTATALASPAQAAPPAVLKAANVLAFEPLPLFLATEKQAPAPFDWRTDGCSTPDIGTLKATVDAIFLDACVRHDFGYRNFGGTGLRLDPTEKRRAAVDLQFYRDMQLICRTLPAGEQGFCGVVAFAFYLAVRIFGATDFGTTSSTVTPQQRQQIAPYLEKISG